MWLADHKMLFKRPYLRHARVRLSGIWLLENPLPIYMLRFINRKYTVKLFSINYCNILQCLLFTIMIILKDNFTKICTIAVAQKKIFLQYAAGILPINLE